MRIPSSRPFPPASAILQLACGPVLQLAHGPQGHAGPVTSVQLYSLPGGGALLVSTGGDAETRIWEGPTAGTADGAASGWRLRQTITVDGKLQLSAALTATTVDGDWCAGPLLKVCVRLAGCVPGLCTWRSMSSARLTSSAIAIASRHLVDGRYEHCLAACGQHCPTLPLTRA